MVMLVAHIFPKDHVPKCGTGSKEAEPVPDIPTIMETFEEEYRESLQALPAELFPQGHQAWEALLYPATPAAISPCEGRS